jgi:hypothetical protein
MHTILKEVIILSKFGKYPYLKVFVVDRDDCPGINSLVFEFQRKKNVEFLRGD